MTIKKETAVQQRLDYRSTKEPSAQPVPFVPGPNPDLPKFIAEHSTPYNPKTDKYDVPAFDRDIVVDKAAEPKAIYDMHTYWSKKHWAAIREYIRHYLPKKFYPEGQGLVCDPFCGSGMTGVAALMENKPCVLIDASPAAAFIAHNYVHPVDPDLLEEAYQKMLTEEYEADLKAKLKKITGRDIVNLQEELDWLYETTCDRCDGKATTEYVVYSQTFQCTNCGEIVPLYDCPTVPVTYEKPAGPRGGKPKTVVKDQAVCPNCYKRAHSHGRTEFVISTRAKKHGEIPVRISYLCRNECSPKRSWRSHNDDVKRHRKYFEAHDLAKLETIAKSSVPHPLPSRKFTKGFIYFRDGLHLRNVESITDLFTKRNAWALGALADAIRRSKVDYLRLSLSSTSLGVSRLIRNRDGGGGFTAGSHSIPAINKELYVIEAHRSKLHTQRQAYEGLLSVIAGERMSVAVVHMPGQEFMPAANSIDFVFTDPPYSARGGQYAELNEVWGAWGGLPQEDLAHEAVVNPRRRITLEEWAERLRGVFLNIFNALKPGHWAAVCYHDVSDAAWKLFQDLLLDTGFEIHSVTVLDPLQKSFNQTNAEKVVKSDLVLNCRKPKSGQLELTTQGSDIPSPIKDRVRTILEDALTEHPGLTRDKLFDIVTRRLLERAQMVEFRFEEILAEIATKAEGDRWYLKAELELLSKHDLANEEAAGEALTRFTQLRCIGTPAKYAAEIALIHPKLCEPDKKGHLDEKAIEDWINDHLAKEDRVLLIKKKINRLELGGALAGIEFYDALFFYFTRYMKGKKAGQLPKRNLPEFLEEYLIHFEDGDKWLYRPPEGREAEELRKARQSGLGRRIRTFANALRDNDREYVKQHRPDVKTFVEWMRYCATFGRDEDGVALFDKGGIAVHELKSVVIDEAEEETAYDAASGFAALCKRRLGPTAEDDEAEETDTGDEEE